MAEIHLGFAGNIGVGKTEFTQQVMKEPNRGLLTAFLKEGEGMKAFKEVLDRRLLTQFYNDNKRWAFTSQMYYLTLRLNIIKRINEFSGLAIEDRTIYEDRNVFGKTNFELGNMHELEYYVYDMNYNEICNYLKPPTLLVYLKVRDVNVLKERINRRGREEEKSISLDYLQKLNDNYEKLFNEYPYPKLAVNAEIDMFEHPSYHQTVVEQIADKLTKLGFITNANPKPNQSMLLKGAQFTY